VISIIVLFFGVSAASSNNIVKNNQAKYKYLEFSDNSENIINRGKNAYVYCAFSPSSPEGPCYFDLDEPDGVTLLATTQSGDFLTGGTWADGYGWLAIEYGSGILWNINPDTGEMTPIGGGGSGLDIAWDDLTEELYSCNGYWIYGTDPIELNTTVPIVSIAFNSEGVCYGIDSTTDSLHLIDISTGEVIFVASLSISLNVYFNYISFDKDTDILYILTDNFYICNTETGECTLTGLFEGYDLTALAIPYNNYNPPPVTTISFDPPTPDGENNWYISNVTASLNATDEDGVYATYYRINDGEWNTYTSPFIISEEGDNILIEFYSIYNLDNVEEVKSKTLDIDKTPPELTIEYNVTKIGYKEWMIEVTFTVLDNICLDPRLDIYYMGVLQDTITGPGPIYEYKFTLKGIFLFTVGAGVSDCAGHYVYNEIEIKLIRNKNQLINNQFLFRFLESYPLLCRLFQKFLL
jgi:hypothetical protein